MFLLKIRGVLLFITDRMELLSFLSRNCIKKQRSSLIFLEVEDVSCLK